MIANRGSGMGPIGTFDMVGMKTAFDILTYWGHENGDKQMLANADYIKTNFLDKGRMGLQTGHGYYRYPNPGYQDPDFLMVPDLRQCRRSSHAPNCPSHRTVRRASVCGQAQRRRVRVVARGIGFGAPVHLTPNPRRSLRPALWSGPAKQPWGREAISSSRDTRSVAAERIAAA